MRSSFTDIEIDRYRTNGFLAVPDFLAPEELEQWRETVTEAVARSAQERTGKNSENSPSSGPAFLL